MSQKPSSLGLPEPTRKSTMFPSPVPVADSPDKTEESHTQDNEAESILVTGDGKMSLAPEEIPHATSSSQFLVKSPSTTNNVVEGKRKHSDDIQGDPQSPVHKKSSKLQVQYLLLSDTGSSEERQQVLESSDSALGSFSPSTQRLLFGELRPLPPLESEPMLIYCTFQMDDTYEVNISYYTARPVSQHDLTETLLYNVSFPDVADKEFQDIMEVIKPFTEIMSKWEASDDEIADAQWESLLNDDEEKDKKGDSEDEEGKEYVEEEGGEDGETHSEEMD
ncbi:hypothetical protein B0T24DRAFT_598150 [Lasiosphaeria ovina]|uniref:Uncharacterized protein n=1 Tax=Lasiosphaeria ovina TaxID=92902 RepID=A0AAE0N0D2_9PEZI|nr:hypothetical protein B0T24DRAFT_598150 [Lasiosphaeria ovina]